MPVKLKDKKEEEDMTEEQGTATTETATTTPAATETVAPEAATQETTSTETASPDDTADVDDAGDDDSGEEEVLSVPKEQLDAIKANPELRKLYRGMTKAYTQRLTALAQDRQIAEAIRQDPLNAAKTLAKIAGLKYEETPPAQPGQKSVDVITKEFADLVGEDAANKLRPIIEKIARTVVLTETNPLREVVEQDRTTAMNARSEAEVTSFKAKHPDVTKAVENKMIELSAKIPPGKDVTPEEYLGFLRTLAIGTTSKTAATKEVVDRMRAAQKTETTSTAPSKVAQNSDDLRKMGIDKAWDEAFSRAKAQHGV